MRRALDIVLGLTLDYKRGKEGSMAVEVRVPALLQKLAGGSKTVQVEGTTVGQLLDNLEKQYPGFKDRVTTSPATLMNSGEYKRLSVPTSCAGHTPPSITIDQIQPSCPIGMDKDESHKDVIGSS